MNEMELGDRAVKEVGCGTDLSCDFVGFFFCLRLL